MTINPSGGPPWLRTAGITDYGGHVSKANYMARGIINPKTDVGADAIMRLSDHLSSAVRTASTLKITYTNNDSSPAAPSVNSIVLQTGIDLDGYVDGSSPPSGFPSFARNGTGDITLTVASSYTDAYGVSGAFAIHGAEATVNGSGNVNASAVWTATTVRVRVYTADTGAALADQQVTVDIW